MGRRLPDRPPNGIGAGERPKLVPTQLDAEKSLYKLVKPFKIPYKVIKRKTNVGSDGRTGGITLRERKVNINYAGFDVDKETSSFVSKTGKLPRKDALSAKRLMEDSVRLSQIENILKKNFSVPMKGYVQRHSLPMTLGTKRKIVSEPRPLHDPADEFAIILYDPSVDGDMLIQNDSELVSTPSPPPSATQSANDKDANVIQQTHIQSQKFTHPKMMSNGLRNKPLSELIQNSYDDGLDKKFPNIPVVIDPKLSKILRPHQVEGVRFLYRCVTGLVMKDFLDSETIKNNVDLHLSQEEPIETSISDNTRIAEINENNENIPSDTNKVASTVAKPKPKKSKKKEQSEEFENAIKELNSQNKGAYGCIMADEMGLGKTLQCIALMWTLLRQGPQGKRLIDKCIIVCPSSLVNNWANELIKWLGPGTLSPLAIDGKKSSLANVGNATVAQAIKNWAQAKGRNIVKPVLIISYETLRRNVDQLVGTNVGLMLADEGHRLKNAESLTFTALHSINCPRRVILSGTPIQNDLSEYFALLNFSNPGLLGTKMQFRRNFEIPILRSRDADATQSEIEKGAAQLQKLSYIVSKFIIRRTNDILSKYLPCKYEHVIFVNLKPFQTQIYKKFVESREVVKLVKDTNGSQPLRAIGLLKKLCNHPNLLNLQEELKSLGTDLTIPNDYDDNPNSKSREIQSKYSGKFSILERFLQKIKSESDDKIVLISNYTQTLDLIEKLCRNKRYGVLRLDGTMNINKRQKLVDRFNDPEGQEFVFLLSSKAGGCGINLIGANRLILLDPDWNPAADQQALARVWRDGQKKDCFIYRFISTGTIEEKVYQRQSMKMSLSSCVVDEKEDVERLFSVDNLKQLFQLDEKTICDTHTTFSCKRCNKDGKQNIRSKTMLYGDATTWNHLDHNALKKTNDHLLKNESEFNDVSYVFQYISH